MNKGSTEKQVFNLAPEDYLTQALSSSWQARFDKILTYIVNHISEQINWDQLAQECAISPSHFHYMFRIVLNESPGQYLRRMRLKVACHYLVAYPKMPVIDIAVDVGFSTSQALAKVLKRDLGVTASAIRAASYLGDDGKLSDIYMRLAAPNDAEKYSLEGKLAKEIPMQISSEPEQYFYTKPCFGSDLHSTAKKWKSMAPASAADLCMITHSQDIDNNYHETEFKLGYEAENLSANYSIAAMKFLSCQVKISSESGYFTAWHSLYQYMLRHNLQWQDNAIVIERIHNPRSIFSRTMDMTLSVSLSD